MLHLLSSLYVFQSFHRFLFFNHTHVSCPSLPPSLPCCHSFLLFCLKCSMHIIPVYQIFKVISQPTSSESQRWATLHFFLWYSPKACNFLNTSFLPSKIAFCSDKTNAPPPTVPRQGYNTQCILFHSFIKFHQPSVTSTFSASHRVADFLNTTLM